jgi:hypothetical protein
MKNFRRRPQILLAIAVRKILSLRPRSKGDALVMSLILLLAWDVATAALSVNGIYSLVRLLQLGPGYWAAYVWVVVATIVIAIGDALRNALVQLTAYLRKGWEQLASALRRAGQIRRCRTWSPPQYRYCAENRWAECHRHW